MKKSVALTVSAGACKFAKLTGRSMSSSPQVTPIIKDCLLGEAPHWDHEAQALYFTDVPGQVFHRYEPASGKHTKINTGFWLSFIIPVKGTKDKFIISKARDFAVLTWNGEENGPFNVESLHTVDKDKTDNNLNDGKVDPRGRLWAGTMGPILPVDVIPPNRGALFTFTSDRKVKTHLTEISISNGLAWSLDHKIFYYIDSPTKKVEAFDYDIEKGEISNRRTAFDLQKHDLPGVPDGMAIDAEGKLWVATFGGGQVLRVDPTNGSLLTTVKIPSSQVTSVAFGGANFDELYVTTASKNIDKSKEPLAGATFKVTGLGVKGLPAEYFPKLP